MIACPVCSSSADSEQCPSCGADLTPLLQTRRIAYRLAGEAYRLARERQLERAADRAERVAQLHLDERLGQLCGWLLFLDCRISDAARCWREEVPNTARSVLHDYNQALDHARGGRWTEALEALDEVSLPFRPAWVLRFISLQRLGMSEEAQEVRDRLQHCFPSCSLEGVQGRLETAFDPVEVRPPREGARPWSLATGAVALLLVGTGAGFLLSGEVKNSGEPGRTVDGSPGDSAPLSASVGPTDTVADEQKEPADSLAMAWAFLHADAGEVLNGVPEVSAPRPAGPVRSIPLEVRERVAHGWYLRGLDAFEADRFQEAEPSLQAAVASVGSASKLYWVDDALYMLMRSQQELERSKPAATWASTLLEHHEGSMYVNSITRTAASQTREELP